VGVTWVVDFRILGFLFVTLLDNYFFLDLTHTGTPLGLRAEEHVDSNGLLAAHAGSFAADGGLGLFTCGGLEALVGI
jgi:hypothetical protein